MQEPHDCLFCGIVSGKHGSFKVYEDDKVLAFLDIRPIHRGHTLVVPREHYENIHEIPDEVLAYVHMVAKRIAAAQQKAWSSPGIAIAQNNGRAAGQVIFHFHVHVIPKEREQEIRHDASKEELQRTADELSEALGVR